MKYDESYMLYKKYFSLQNRVIEMVLKNNIVLKGLFIGFFPGDADAGEGYITQWHFVNEGEDTITGADPFGFLIGRIIQQDEIVQVKFLADGSIMQFKKRFYEKNMLSPIVVFQSIVGTGAFARRKSSAR